MKKYFASIYKVSFLLIFLMASVGQFQRVQLTGQVAFYIHEILLLIFLLINGIYFVIYQKASLSKIKTHLDLSTAVLFCYITLQTLIWQLVSLDLVPLLYLLRLSTYLLFPLAIWYGVHHKLLTKRELYLTLMSFGGAITVFGLIQYVIIPDTRFLFFLGWDDHYYRLISTLFDPGFAGILIAMTILLFLSRHLDGNRYRTLKNYAISALAVLALLLTYSRASYLAIGVGLLVLAIMSKKIQPIFLILIIGASLFFLPRPGGEGVKLERTFSAQARIDTTMTSIQSIDPLTALVGRGWYRDLKPSKNGLINTAKTTDNSLVFIFISTGIVGMILILWWMWMHKQLFMSTTFLPIFSAVLVHSMFNNSLFYNFCLLMLGGVAVLAVVERD